MFEGDEELEPGVGWIVLTVVYIDNKILGDPLTIPIPTATHKH